MIRIVRYQSTKIMSKITSNKRVWRHKRVRAKIFGTRNLPRLSVFRSNRFMQAQIIDDEKGQTLISIFSRGLAEKKNKSGQAKEAGLLLAKKAAKKGISKVVFDRGGYAYTGRVKNLAEGAREGGLIF